VIGDVFHFIKERRQTFCMAALRLCIL